MRKSDLIIVGISTRSVLLPGRLDPVWGVFSSYLDSVRTSGAEAVLLPPDTVDALSRIDALLLVGGEDLADETWWSAGTPLPPIDAQRDDEEESLTQRARGLGLPTLGICRGAQLVNCVLGGKVARFDLGGIAEHCSQNPAESVEHYVRIAPGTRLALAMSHRAEFPVVSRHATRVSELGVGLQASAWAADGSIEAIEALDWPFLGVQWHAEWSMNELGPDLSIFRWLVAEAKQRTRQ